MAIKRERSSCHFTFPFFTPSVPSFLAPACRLLLGPWPEIITTFLRLGRAIIISIFPGWTLNNSAGMNDDGEEKSSFPPGSPPSCANYSFCSSSDIVQLVFRSLFCLFTVYFHNCNFKERKCSQFRAKISLTRENDTEVAGMVLS